MVDRSLLYGLNMRKECINFSLFLCAKDCLNLKKTVPIDPFNLSKCDKAF